MMSSETIIICTGLTRKIVSPEQHLQTSLSNIGRSEIGRLMGSGREAGAGPLPSFLRQVCMADAQHTPRSRVLFISEDESSGFSKEGAGNPGDALQEPFREFSAYGKVIRSSGGLVPWDSLRRSIEEIRGLAEGGESKPVRFLVVGCHTEGHVLAISLALRQLCGFEEVAVCSHLVGSANQEAHHATLRHNLPLAGVRVILDLDEAADFVGLNPAPLSGLSLHPCAIEPDEVRESLDADQQRIIELLCLNWDRASLRSLQGGFSGSLLLLAEGWQGSAQTEPMVLKIDAVGQMRREIDGYHRVKDFCGKHVPTFGYPVALGERIGVGMELAAMEGHPETLQDHFEAADSEDALRSFLTRLEKSIDQLSSRLYRNTRSVSTVVPYRDFLLHTKDQLVWLEENAGTILEYWKQEDLPDAGVDPDEVRTMVGLVVNNEDGLESEICLAHGDLNMANIICDRADNIWFIDWTHTGQHLIELDFAKLENDIKFVASKEFDCGDVSRLKRFEEYLLTHPVPAETDGLPQSLKFVKWDLRYRKILAAVARIRRACFDLKEGEDWLIYKIALLRYALHTLSFDKRRGKGECELPQLMHALCSAETLAFELVTDDYHLRIRGERPPSYPQRQRVSLDQALWAVESGVYDPPYHVDPAVIASDRSRVDDGWADPEDLNRPETGAPGEPSGLRDGRGRLLNPRGRTGLQGRGLLGRWGANAAVSVVVTRRNPETAGIEMLLGKKAGRVNLSLPRGFVLPGESAVEAATRVVEDETGIVVGLSDGDAIADGYYYDPRQTDHAWVELTAFFYHSEDRFEDVSPSVTETFAETEWWPLTSDTINEIDSGGATLARKAADHLRETGTLEQGKATEILSQTE
jgi:ADP-ribose pyrophosphatase YjhB (NUDIX family)